MYIYIYIYILGWSNNNFNNLHFNISLGTYKQLHVSSTH